MNNVKLFFFTVKILPACHLKSILKKFQDSNFAFRMPRAIIYLALSYAKSAELNSCVCFPISRNSNGISGPASGTYAEPNSFRYTRSIVIACIVSIRKGISHAVLGLWTWRITGIASWTWMPLEPDVHRCADTINLIPSSTKWRESKHPNESCWELKTTFPRFSFKVVNVEKKSRLRIMR